MDRRSKEANGTFAESRPSLRCSSYFPSPTREVSERSPIGSDLDNLLKRFFDALIETVFLDAPGKDGIVVSIEATKVRVGHSGEAGADLEIIEIEKVN